MSWYNKYRPQSFEDVVGQELVKSVLQNALAKNFIKQAYLFSGSRGVGKTTLARIFANLLNQVQSSPEAKIDIIELDAASNTGIDNIRQLIENSNIPPLSGKYKVYIIDEVHMLSKSAMSALLKTLEEPPRHVVFLLATTNPEKLLPTVLSRLTKLPLSSHTIQNIVSRLQFITEKENLKIDTQSLELIAKRAEGSQRDAINLMETVSSYNLDEFSVEKTAEILGVIPETFLVEIADKIASQNLDKNFLQKLSQVSFDGETFLGQFLEFLLDQTLSGNSDYSSLIPVTAEVLSWKLPVTSIAQTIALLQANLSQKEGVVGVKKKPTEERAVGVNSEVKKVDLNSNSNNFEIKNNKASVNFEKDKTLALENEITGNLNTNSKSIETQKKESSNLEENEASNTKNTTVENNSNTDPNSLFAKILKAPNSPTILKMLGHDLRLEKVENNKVVFSVTTNLFLSQLKSATLQNFLKEFLTSELKFVPEIENIIRAKSAPQTEILELKNFQDISYEEPPQESYETEYFEPETAPQKPAEITSQKIPDLTPGKKIFYEVYKNLPEGFSNTEVQVYKDSIPSPAPKNTDNEWETEAESIFDLE